MPQYDNRTSGNPHVAAFHELLGGIQDFAGFLADPGERQGIRQGFTDAVNRGAVAATLGAPVDLANMGLNLGKAAVGYLGNKAGVLSADQMPQPEEKPFLGSEYFGDLMQRGGAVSPNRNALAETAANFLTFSPVKSAKAVAAIAGGGMVPGVESAMFIGPNSKTWNGATARQALEMEKAGVDPREIWSKTGNFRGADGRLRQEIDDSGVLFNASGPAGSKVSNDVTFNGNPDFNYGHPVVRNSLIEHPELEKAYGRSLAKNSYIRNKNTLFGDGTLGSFDPATESITMYAPARAQDARSTAIHELQHAVQTREGFARGGNAKEMRNAPEVARLVRELEAKADAARDAGDKAAYMAATDARAQLLGDDGFGAYQRLAGEAEARATQARIDMTPEQRRATFPYDSYDVPVNQLIIRR